MIVTEYRGYLIEVVPATAGSTVYRIRGLRDIWNPIFYSMAAAERYIDAELSVDPRRDKAPV